MCLICQSFQACSFDPYSGTISSGSGGTGSSTAASQPVFSYDQIAYYLTNQFWADVGSSTRKLDVYSGDILTVNLTSLTALGQSTAKDALDA